MKVEGHDVEVLPVVSTRWDDLVDLFERPGPRGGTPMPGSCWCMWWRERSGDAATNREAMRAIVDTGAPPGLLAYVDGTPAGWVSLARRHEYGQLMRSRTYRPTDGDEAVFVIACFYVDPGFKRQGLARYLLRAAIDSAKDRGATAVEAYPKEPPDHMGVEAWFSEAGFHPVRAAGKRRIVRLDL